MPVITFLEIISAEPKAIERAVLIGLLILQMLCLAAIVTAIFIKKGSKEFTPGDFIKNYLRKSSWFHGILWVLLSIGALIFQNKVNVVVAQWIVSCLGITLFMHLSIFEDIPPQESARRTTLEQPLNPSIND